MKTLKYLFLVTLTIVFLAACTKEGPAGPTGPAGPAGPTGLTGATGSAGSNGTNGTNGTNGNANVITISLLTADITWTAGSFFGRTANTYALTNTGVNSDIIDHGTVLGYYRTSSTWSPLPFYWENNAGTSRQSVVFTYALNTITLWAWATSGALIPSVLSEYRFLLITDNTVTPAKGVSASSEILDKFKKAGVDVNDYYEVMDYFGLDY